MAKIVEYDFVRFLLQVLVEPDKEEVDGIGAAAVDENVDVFPLTIQAFADFER